VPEFPENNQKVVFFKNHVNDEVPPPADEGRVLRFKVESAGSVPECNPVIVVESELKSRINWER